MSTARLFTEPITVTTVTEVVGADGRVTESTDDRQFRGAFRQRAAIDGFEDGLVVTDEAVVYLPPDVSLSPGDRLSLRGQTYEVVSTAFPQVNFRTRAAHHLEVRARRSQR